MNKFRRISFFGCVLFALIISQRGVTAQISESPASEIPRLTAVKSYSPESNYMSLSGFKRWRHFQESGVWAPVTAVESKLMGDSMNFDYLPSRIEQLKALQKLIKSKPSARRYIVYWRFDMVAFNSHETLLYSLNYDVDGRKMMGEGLTLDDEILDALIKRWDVLFATKGETLKEMLDWWEKQK